VLTVEIVTAPLLGMQKAVSLGKRSLAAFAQQSVGAGSKFVR
jgi:hypothetical protein